METQLTLSSVFPSRAPDALKTITVQRGSQSPLVLLDSNLDKHQAADLSENTKLIVVGMTKSLSKLQERNWESLSQSFKQSPLLEQLPDSEFNSSTQLAKHFNAFTPALLAKDPLVKMFLDHNPQYASLLKQVEENLDTLSKTVSGDQETNLKNIDKTITPQEIQVWFEQLVKNNPVILGNINPTFYTEILAWIGANLLDLSKKESLPILDLAIVQYPSTTSPYFELISVKVNLWAQVTKTTVSTTKKAGLSGDFIVQKFGPRTSILESLKPEVKAKALGEIIGLF